MDRSFVGITGLYRKHVEIGERTLPGVDAKRSSAAPSRSIPALSEANRSSATTAEGSTKTGRLVDILA